MSSPLTLEPLATFDAALLIKLAGSVFALAVVSIATLWRRSSLPTPPGPPPILLIGNLLDMPPANSSPWLKYSEWAQKYGDVVHLKSFGQHMIILNSPEACEDLLVKRGAKYSDRPVSTMADMSGWGRSLVMQSHNDAFRAMRRMCAPLMGTHQYLAFVPYIERATHEFLRRLSANTGENSVKDNLHWLNAGTILKMVYGYTIRNDDDPFVRNADRALRNFSKASTPGWIVDVVPSLRQLPLWIPGAKFLRLAAVWKKETDRMYDGPFDWVKQQVARGEHSDPNSIISKYVENNLDPEMERLVKYGMGTIYAGGSGTSLSAQRTFFLAMTLHPEIQRRAQAELDAVTEGIRLPTHADRPHLPFVNALVLEVLRWGPPIPAGIPHACRTEDVYRGWRIPAGTIVIPNVWHLTHDPARWKDPLTFNPDRFLGDGPNPDVGSYVFGTGRRECPGKPFADMRLFVTLASILAVFDTTKQVDSNGKDIVPEVRYSGGSISHPLPFAFKVTPRSEKALGLLQSADH